MLISQPVRDWRSFLQRSLVLLALVSCATVPEADPVIIQSNSGDPPKVMGANGPLTYKQSKALFQHLGLNPENSDLFKRHLVIEQAVAETPLVAGNSTKLLKDGPETFKAIFEEIRGAKKHINMEYYILEDIEYDGQKLSDLLIQKRKEGVAINIIYDYFGSFTISPEFFSGLQKEGIKLLPFNPINPLKARLLKSPNDRDHRKIFVVDGQVAIVGGINLSHTYQSTPKSENPADAQIHWRDTDMEIRGPAVTELQKLFFDQWHKHKGEKVEEADYYPQLKPQGSEIIRVIASAPDEGIARYYVTMLSAIRNAEKSIWITNSYFAPPKDLKRDLMEAAARGVDVRLLVPNKIDVKPLLAIQRSHYGDLLKAGIKIYENPKVILHAKSAVIDGVWTVIGSSNLDHRSVLYNDEVDVVVLGTQTGKEIEQMFEADVRKSRQISLEEWQKRPMLQRVNEFFSRFFQNML